MYFQSQVNSVARNWWCFLNLKRWSVEGG